MEHGIPHYCDSQIPFPWQRNDSHRQYFSKENIFFFRKDYYITLFCVTCCIVDIGFWEGSLPYTCDFKWKLCLSSFVHCLVNKYKFQKVCAFVVFNKKLQTISLPTHNVFFSLFFPDKILYTENVLTSYEHSISTYYTLNTVIDSLMI